MRYGDAQGRQQPQQERTSISFATSSLVITRGWATFFRASRCSFLFMRTSRSRPCLWTCQATTIEESVPNAKRGHCTQDNKGRCSINKTYLQVLAKAQQDCCHGEVIHVQESDRSKPSQLREQTEDQRMSSSASTRMTHK